MKTQNNTLVSAGRGLALLLPGAFALADMASASTDYPPAIWRPACNGHWYTSHNTRYIYVIHDMEGYYWGSISHIQNCNSTVSVHYLVNGKKDTASDSPAGEISQGVRDAYSGWTSGCWNR